MSLHGQSQQESAANSAWSTSEAMNIVEMHNTRRHDPSHKPRDEPRVRSSYTESAPSTTRAARHKVPGQTDARPTRSRPALESDVGNPQDKIQLKKPESAGLFDKFVSMFRMQEPSSEADTLEQTDLLKKLSKMETDNKRMRQDLKEKHEVIAALKHDYNEHHQITIQNANNQIEAIGEELRNKEVMLDETTRAAQAQLNQANSDVARLKKIVADNEVKLSKAYTAAVSSLARDVSREFPDDAVRGEISKFFQGDFISWCADMCAARISGQEKAVEYLHSVGITNSSQSYLEGPRHLQFDMNMPDESSPFVLLQAALAKVLCETFLTNPYFLAEEQQGLKGFEEKLSRGSRETAMDWRIQTVECLEKMSPVKPELFKDRAQLFETEFGFLLEKLDHEAREDLISLFTQFAHLALNLWKIRTTFSVLGMADLAHVQFRLGSDQVDAEPTAVSALGQQLNGRPIAVVIRPLFISRPVMPKGKPQEQVVWSKALAWVSAHR